MKMTLLTLKYRTEQSKETPCQNDGRGASNGGGLVHYVAVAKKMPKKKEKNGPKTLIQLLALTTKKSGQEVLCDFYYFGYISLPCVFREGIDFSFSSSFWKELLTIITNNDRECDCTLPRQAVAKRLM